MLKEATRTEGLPRGYRGTDKTIRRMHKLVTEAKLDPTMHRIATWIRLQVPQDHKGSTREMAQAIFDWIKNHGVFQRDQFQIERVEHPISSMQSIVKARKSGAYQGPGLFVGDCDQFSIWAAALGGLLGFQYAFETAKTDLRRPDEFSHVWTALLVGKDWIPLDASTRGAHMGWRPPVDGDRFKRWPEKEIGGGMSGTNGRANGKARGYYPGLSGVPPGQSPSGRRAWEGNYVPTDYFGWGAPKSYDWDDSEPVLTDTDPSRLDLLVPQEPAIPAEEMYDDTRLIRKEPPQPPSYRPSLVQGDEQFETGPRYAPPGPHPYYAIRDQFYPAGSKFNRMEVSNADRSKIKRGTMYHVENLSNVPVRDVEIAMDSPRLLKREKGRTMVQRRNGSMVMMRPRRLPAGMGAVEKDELLSLQMVQADTEQVAKEASTSVWDTITSTITKAAEVGAEVYAEKLKAKYADKLATATNSVTGRPTVTAETYYRPPSETPWYMSPWVWVGGALVVGGTAYALTRGKGGGRRRYRRRRR